MPKQSKITSTRPGAATPVKDRPEKFHCTRCARSFTKQKGNFPGAQSPLWRENNGYLPVCRYCVEELYQHYKEALGDERAAIRRLCLKFDLYWNEEIYRMLVKTCTSNSRILSYISKSNLYKFVGKTYDDTLAEEAEIVTLSPASSTDDAEPEEQQTAPIEQEVIDFWGPGLTPAMYMELEQRRSYWMSHLPAGVELGIGLEALIRQICNMEVDINRDRAAGRSVDKAVGTLNTLLGSAMLKPSQKIETGDSALDRTPLGVWTKRWEDKRPLPAEDPELQNPNPIVKYIDIWFKGHLAKMLGKKNAYSALYEQEIGKIRLERPEFEDEDDESVFYETFGGGDSDDEV